MGLIKLGLLAGAGYAIARKVNNHNNNSSHSHSTSRNESDTRPPFRDTKSGYQHQGYCNGQCGRTCNGQQTHGLHDWTCNGQCGGQCVTQRRTAGSPRSPTFNGGGAFGGGAAQSYYAAGGLGEREGLPSYQGSHAAPAAVRFGDVKA